MNKHELEQKPNLLDDKDLAEKTAVFALHVKLFREGLDTFDYALPAYDDRSEYIHELLTELEGALDTVEACLTMENLGSEMAAEEDEEEKEGKEIITIDMTGTSSAPEVQLG